MWEYDLLMFVILMFSFKVNFDRATGETIPTIHKADFKINTVGDVVLLVLTTAVFIYEVL